MLKKIISLVSATFLVASGVSFLSAPTANAVAPVISSTSTISNTQANPSISITTTASSLNSTFANWPIDFGTTGLTRSGMSTSNGNVTISLSGTATCGGTLTVRANAAAYLAPLQTENSNTLSFVIAGASCSNDSTLSATSTIKGVAITSLGTPGTNPNNVVARGSVTISASQAADTSNSGSFVTSFVKNESNATLVYVSKNSSSQAGTTINSYTASAAINSGDYFVIYMRSQDRSSFALYIIDVTIGSAPAVAICSSELLSSSSTIKGVAFTSGTRQVTSTDFNSSGSSYMGSITLTEAEASGNGATSIVATGSATATWLHVGPSVQSWGDDDISTTANLAGVTLANGELFEIKISGSSCTDYYRISITVTAASTEPTLSEEEIAAIASAEIAQQAATAAAKAAAISTTAIAKAKVALSTLFSTNKSSTLEQFLDAGYGVRNSEVAAKVSAAILKLPAPDRENTQRINEIINLENFIDRVSVLGTRSTVKSSDLVSRGLLPADSVKKHSAVQGLASYPDGSLNSLEKIEAAIKEQIAKAQAPRLRTAEIRARIAARNK